MPDADRDEIQVIEDADGACTIVRSTIRQSGPLPERRPLPGSFWIAGVLLALGGFTFLFGSAIGSNGVVALAAATELLGVVVFYVRWTPPTPVQRVERRVVVNARGVAAHRGGVHLADLADITVRSPAHPVPREAEHDLVAVRRDGTEIELFTGLREDDAERVRAAAAASVLALNERAEAARREGAEAALREGAEAARRAEEERAAEAERARARAARREMRAANERVISPRLVARLGADAGTFREAGPREVSLTRTDRRVRWKLGCVVALVSLAALVASLANMEIARGLMMALMMLGVVGLMVAQIVGLSASMETAAVRLDGEGLHVAGRPTIPRAHLRDALVIAGPSGSALRVRVEDGGTSEDVSVLDALSQEEAEEACELLRDALVHR